MSVSKISGLCSLKNYIMMPKKLKQLLSDIRYPVFKFSVVS